MDVGNLKCLKKGEDILPAQTGKRRETKDAHACVVVLARWIDVKGNDEARERWALRVDHPCKEKK